MKVVCKKKEYERRVLGQNYMVESWRPNGKDNPQKFPSGGCRENAQGSDRNAYY